MAIATLIHVVLLYLFVRQIGAAEHFAEPQSMSVSLVRPKTPRSSSRRERPPHRDASVGLRTSPSSPLNHVELAPQASTPAEANANLAGMEAAQRTLQALSKCRPDNLARLSAEERGRCAERARAGYADGGMPHVNLDPSGRYVENPEPYLNRRPTNGCKPRAAGDVGPLGVEGARAGVGCAFSF